MATPHLDLVLLWHMHQPDYRDYATGEFTMPWVYLHALKDYSDMAVHLESAPGMKAVVNFVPILLDQLEDYADQLATHRLRDPLLRLLAAPDLGRISPEDRRIVLDSCFHANHERMIEPFPSYRRLKHLFDIMERAGEIGTAYLSGQYLADLLTWYHLAWTGESVRRSHELVPRLLSKGERFTHADRLALLDLIREVVSGIIPRYRKLAASGRVEVSTTPHFHPLAPALLDFGAARESEPDAMLPQAQRYPGGRARLGFHLDSALLTHAERFGSRPRGVWPAEGAVSHAVLEVFGQRGVEWIASGEGVLVNSLRKAERTLSDKPDWLYRPYREQGPSHAVACFFRDDRLSDLIGFEYCRWHGADAVKNFIGELEAIAHGAPQGEVPLVSIILDGENAWEFYPYNGFYFLHELYRGLESHPFIRTTTYGAWLDEAQRGERKIAVSRELPRIAAGSWVYGNLATWIGSPDKNHAWDLLVAAKQAYDLVMESGRLTEEEQQAAAIQLASCESSDWFWWFGDYNPGRSVASFDRLFRQNLAHLYTLLKLPPPESLSHAISVGTGRPEAGGAMRRSA